MDILLEVSILIIGFILTSFATKKVKLKTKFIITKYFKIIFNRVKYFWQFLRREKGKMLRLNDELSEIKNNTFSYKKEDEDNY
jgi:hypothetical protein